MQRRRSQLYVPANDEKKIRKSVSLDADSIVFDLEDAVPAEGKASARSTLISLLKELDWGGRELCVRINYLGHDYSPEDILALKSISKISAVVLPKAEEITKSVQQDIGLTLIPLIETARGLLNAEEIVKSKNVSAVSFGPQDFANSVGGSVDVYRNNPYVKTVIAVASRAYGIDPIDGVYFDLNNSEGFRVEAMESRKLGYVGKQVVHPSQIKIANEVYSPTPQEIEQAKRIAEMYEKAAKGGKIGALRVDDMLVDAVHYRNAKSLLERAGQTTT